MTAVPHAPSWHRFWRTCVRSLGGVGMSEHGTYSRYVNQRCRCIRCREASRAQAALRRQRRNAPNHGTVSGYVNHGCRCDPCRGASAAAEVAGRGKSQADSRERATRHGQPWTGAELEIAERQELSARQVADLLGRTVYAVKTMRSKLDEPKYAKAAGVRDA